MIETEILRLQDEIDKHEHEARRITAQIGQVVYTPEHIDDIKATCAKIAVDIVHFTLAEKREVYQLLELNVRLTVEEGIQVAYAECVIHMGQKRLPIGEVFAHRHEPIP